MVTIKSYTDLPQSKKLAEILPIESADMYWRSLNLNGHISWSSHIKRLEPPIYDLEHYTPCWSLAALLELLPKRLEIMDNVYELSVYLYGLYYWNINNGNLCFEAQDKDNLVDACYEAIVFLHEQKLL